MRIEGVREGAQACLEKLVRDEADAFADMEAERGRVRLGMFWRLPLLWVKTRRWDRAALKRDAAEYVFGDLTKN